MENRTESQLLSDEITLLDLWNIIHESKFFIVFLLYFFRLAAFSTPTHYLLFGKNLMMISPEESQTNFQDSGNLGNLASLVGINFPQSSNKQQTALAILDSRIF